MSTFLMLIGIGLQLVGSILLALDVFDKSVQKEIEK